MLPKTTPSAGGVPMIVRGRITKINAEKFGDIPVSGMELNVHIDKVSANNQYLEVHYDWSVKFKVNVGHIDMKGFLMVEMDPALVAQIAARWTADKKLPDEVASTVIHNIHYKCGAEAVLPAKVLELPPPIMPPKINLSGDPAKQPQSQASPAKPAPYPGPPRRMN